MVWERPRLVGAAPTGTDEATARELALELARDGGAMSAAGHCDPWRRNLRRKRAEARKGMSAA
eukprot:3818970-Alexandrium_andersonii.AAC.1